MKSKSYWLKSEKGNIASVTLPDNKKPSKEHVKTLIVMVDIAFTKLRKSKLPIK